MVIPTSCSVKENVFSVMSQGLSQFHGGSRPRFSVCDMRNYSYSHFPMSLLPKILVLTVSQKGTGGLYLNISQSLTIRLFWIFLLSERICGNNLKAKKNPLTLAPAQTKCS